MLKQWESNVNAKFIIIIMMIREILTCFAHPFCPAPAVSAGVRAPSAPPAVRHQRRLGTQRYAAATLRSPHNIFSMPLHKKEKKYDENS